MAYTNEIPTASTVENLGSQHSYEEIVTAIKAANEINLSYQALMEEAWQRVNSKMNSTDFFCMDDASCQLSACWYEVRQSVFIEAVCTTGSIGHGSSEFWPVKRIQKDIKALSRKIKIIKSFVEAL